MKQKGFLASSKLMLLAVGLSCGLDSTLTWATNAIEKTQHIGPAATGVPVGFGLQDLMSPEEHALAARIRAREFSSAHLEEPLKIQANLKATATEEGGESMLANGGAQSSEEAGGSSEEPQD